MTAIQDRDGIRAALIIERRTNPTGHQSRELCPPPDSATDTRSLRIFGNTFQRSTHRPKQSAHNLVDRDT
jgi:hypothetical protein